MGAIKSGRRWKVELTGEVPPQAVADAERAGVPIDSYIGAWLMANVSVAATLLPFMDGGNASVIASNSDNRGIGPH